MSKRFLHFLFLFLISGFVLAADPLSPLVAFKPTARAVDGQTIEVHFEIAKGYYLYRDKFRFAAEPTSVQLGAPVLPKGKEKEDDTFGRVEVYYDAVSIRLPVERNSSGVLPLTLNVTSQGCADIGVCYPPQKQSLGLELPEAVPVDQPVPPVAADESGRIAQLLSGASAWVVIASFFGFGLLLSLTPCVFPMIPILSGIIVGAGRTGKGISHARGFGLSLGYVLGMAVTYAAAGVAAGLSGTLWSASLQNAWVLGGFALIFVALSLSMFGFYELQLPSFMQSRISEGATHLKGGSLAAVTLMGALSALIVGPCVAAPLAGALLYIGQTGDAVLGGTALFSMGVGMGVPLLAVGLSAGTLLPKSGAWMTSIKKVFGVVLLATALWTVSPLLPVAVQMLGWAALLIVPAIFMHAIDPLPPHAHAAARFWKGIGLLMLLAGAAMLAGALSGATDPLRPLAALGSGGASAETRALPFERVRSVKELDERVRTAGRPVMLDFYADWCVSCKEMERFTFSDPRVQQRLSGWLLLQADVTANADDDKALLARFGLFGPPGILFFDGNGEAVRDVRVIGYQRAEEFLRTLAQLPH
ncbi:MAG: protein-disulfide reductase DsbD [Propionivibrio sp.]